MLDSLGNEPILALVFFVVVVALIVVVVVLDITGQHILMIKISH